MPKIKTTFSKDKLKQKIEEIYERIASSKKVQFSEEHIDTINEVIGIIDRGHLRIAEPVKDGWKVNEWLKKAILLYFRTQTTLPIESGAFTYLDKVPVKKWKGDEGVRIVPPASVRYGAFVSPGCVVMPSFVNIGAYVGQGTMVDTWATVGSCAQIGANCHLSGGVGIGGVLEPVQAKPVVIEDDCFIGSRVVVVEGVWVEMGAVLGAGVVLTSSTKIIDVSGSEPVTYTGRVPRYSVVIPGSTIKKFPAGEYGVPCALIIGKRTDSTDRKTSLNQALREFNVQI